MIKTWNNVESQKWDSQLLTSIVSVFCQNPPFKMTRLMAPVDFIIPYDIASMVIAMQIWTWVLIITALSSRGFYASHKFFSLSLKKKGENQPVNEHEYDIQKQR